MLAVPASDTITDFFCECLVRPSDISSDMAGPRVFFAHTNSDVRSLALGSF